MNIRNIKTSILSTLSILLFGCATQQDVDRSQVPEAAKAPEIKIPKPQQFKLDNGLTVLVVEDHSVPKVSWRLFVDYDPILEGEKAGMLSMFGESLSSGTENRSKVEIDKETDFIGASSSFFSRGFYASSLTKHQDKLLDILKDVTLHPTFPKEELDKIRKKTISNIKNNKSSANAKARNLRKVVNYGKDHPYGEIKRVETVENVLSKDLKSFYNTYFKPNVSYLVVVGDINKEQAKEKVEKTFGDWEKAEVPEHNYDQPELPEANQVYFVEKKGAVQSEIRITFPVDFPPNADDAITANVMSSILGGGVFSGRLMQNLREDKGYTYGIRANLSKDQLIGQFYTNGSFRNEVTDSAITQILKELETITKEQVEDGELSLTKNSINGSFARSLEKSRRIANFALNTIRYDLPENYYQNYLTNLSKVTKEDVLAAAKKYIHPHNANIVVVGNKDVIEKIKQFSENGKVDQRNMYGNEAKKLKPAPKDLTAQKVINRFLKAKTRSKTMEEAKKKYKNLESIHKIMKASLQGRELKFESYNKAPNKSSRIISMGGMQVQKSYFNGKKGGSTSMRGDKELTEEEIEQKKVESRLDLEIKYKELGYKLELMGIDEIDGVATYKVKIKSPEGSVTFNDYSVDSGLLLRSETTLETEQGQSTQISRLKDYKEYEGYMFATKMNVDMGKQQIESNVEKIEVNKEIKDSVFEK